MKTAWMLLPLPLAVLLLAMTPKAPQGGDDPAAKADVVHVVQVSQLQYVDLGGKMVALSGRSMLEVRLIEDAGEHIRLEICYDNGDYSLVDAQAFHLIRAGQDVQEVRFVRTKKERLAFPLLR